MDIQLPVVDGYEATRQIKSDPTLAKTPIIAVSSFAMKGDEAKAPGAAAINRSPSPAAILARSRDFPDAACPFGRLLGPASGSAVETRC
jgi:two-component system cell cycle response regulator DivK